MARAKRLGIEALDSFMRSDSGARASPRAQPNLAQRNLSGIGRNERLRHSGSQRWIICPLELSVFHLFIVFVFVG